MVLVDTDFMVWIYRGDAGSAAFFYQLNSPAISVIVRMELLRGVRDTAEKRKLNAILSGLRLPVLPLTSTIGERACAILEEIGLSNGIDIADCLIAATALEHNVPLVTGNVKHYGVVRGLRLQAFQA
jgi:predicted nucleic acid-binding protein